MEGLVVFALLVALYAVVYYAFGVKKLVKGFEPVGPLLLWKTQAGVRAMDRLSRARRFWAWFGDLGIAATVTMGVLMLLLLVLQLVAFVTDPVALSENAPPAITLVGLPGVNPIIPLWWGIIGLVVALVVHEGAHGVLARLSGMRVKSTGLLFLVVPVGAFVEPDEKDIERSSVRAKNRVFAAGPWANLIVAVVAGSLFSSLFVGALAAPAADGVTVTQVFPGTGAEAAGLQPGDRLLSATGPFSGCAGAPVCATLAGDDAAANATGRNDTADAGGNATAEGNVTGDGGAFAPVGNSTVVFANQTVFSEAMNTTSANATFAFTYVRGDVTDTVEVTLGDRYAALAADGRTPPDWTRGKGFLGVSSLDGRTLGVIRDQLADPFTGGGLGLLFFYPLFVFSQGIDILNPPYSDFFGIEGPLAGLGPVVFFALANLLYWVFWLNLMLGTFNALPAGPLDGGQMFRASVREWLWRRLGVDRGRVVVEDPTALATDAALAGKPATAATVRTTVRGSDDETQLKIDRAQHILKRITMTLGLFILAMILLPLVGPKLVTYFAG